MSNRSSIARVLTLAFTLTSTSVAFARRPPALVERQERAQLVFDACSDSSADPGKGYRDMLVRFRSENPPRRATSPSRTAAANQLACRMESTHGAGGYRDMLVRFLPARPIVQVASTNR